MKGSKVSLIWRNPWNDNLRHNNHAEVQPVPGVPQEGEGADAEAPRQHLYQRLKRVNASERVPERKRKRRDGQRFRARGVKAKAHGWHTESMNADGTQTWSWEEMWSTFTVQQPLWHEWQRVAPWWTAEWTLTPPPSGADGDAAFWSIFLFLVWLGSVYLWVDLVLVCIVPLITSRSQTGSHGIDAESMEFSI